LLGPVQRRGTFPGLHLLDFAVQLILPAFSGAEPALPDPFVDRAPGYFRYLRAERGLRDSSLVQHRHHLRRLETYLKRIELQTLSGLSLTVVSAFITEIGQHYGKPTVRVSGGPKTDEIGRFKNRDVDGRGRGG